MPKPYERLPRWLYVDLARYLARGWGKGMVRRLLFDRYGAQIPDACIDAVKKGRNCGRSCGAGCPVLETMPKETPGDMPSAPVEPAQAHGQDENCSREGHGWRP